MFQLFAGPIEFDLTYLFEQPEVREFLLLAALIAIIIYIVAALLIAIIATAIIKFWFRKHRSTSALTAAISAPRGTLLCTIYFFLATLFTIPLAEYAFSILVNALLLDDIVYAFFFPAALILSTLITVRLMSLRKIPTSKT